MLQFQTKVVELELTHLALDIGPQTKINVRRSFVFKGFWFQSFDIQPQIFKETHRWTRVRHAEPHTHSSLSGLASDAWVASSYRCCS